SARLLRLLVIVVHTPRSITLNGKIAVELVQEGEEALVVARRHLEEGEQFPVAAARFSEAAIDERTKIRTREIVRFERLVHGGPEALALREPAPQYVRRRRHCRQ